MPCHQTSGWVLDFAVRMGVQIMTRDRRSFLRFAAGIGLGAVATEIYERLHHIPSLERRFRSEVTYWMNEYTAAKGMVEKLSEQLNVSKDEISRLSGEVNDWKNRYNTAKEEVERLSSVVNASDAFEKESTAAISFYRERMEEAIRRLKSTIEKYRVILGDERVSFESSSLKVLEDLKITQEKLLKLLPYFPLIKSLEYSPSRVMNDKIYDLSVSLEVISPLNTLKEIEVMLIPVEYRYFITKYGMREEDYDKVFPKEEVRSVKIEPKKLEREMFSVDFEDLKGGKEYIVKARVKDVAGSEKIVEVKTPYIRQFENLGKELYEKGIIVAGSYYLWWGPEYWAHNSPLTLQPLLGWYDSTDQMVLSKHIDTFTGYGINVFFVSWSGRYYEPTYYHDRRLKDIFVNNFLISDVKFVILYETHGRLKKDKDGFIDLNDDENKKKFIEDFEYLSKNYFSHPSYLKIRGRPVVYIYDTPVFTLRTKNVENVLSEMRNRVKISSGYDIYIVSSEVKGWFDPNEFKTQERLTLFECNSDWAAQYGGTIGVDDWFMNNYDDNVLNVYKKYSKVLFELGKDFMPSVIPGFRNVRKEGYTTPHIIVERNVERFIKRLKDAISTTHSDLRLIRFDTLNDHHENTQIEPTSIEGYKVLEAVVNVFKEQF
jgi:hypothetical protein